MTFGEAVNFVYDPAILPGRNPDEQAHWAAFLLAVMRRWTSGGVC